LSNPKVSAIANPSCKDASAPDEQRDGSATAENPGKQVFENET
jgi:hypothetical protein